MTGKLSLVTDGELSGYLLREIRPSLSESNWDRFCSFLAGQTVVITSDGEILVYQCDWERFCRGLPVVRRG
mgnify:CR=1 FL=1